MGTESEAPQILALMLGAIPKQHVGVCLGFFLFLFCVFFLVCLCG